MIFQEKYNKILLIFLVATFKFFLNFVLVCSSKGDLDGPKEYIIPLIKKNLWKKQIDDKLKKTAENKTELPPDSLESLAAQEIVAGRSLILSLL